MIKGLQYADGTSQTIELLTPLEALNDLREVKGWNDNELNKRLDVIENALKDLEEYKKCIDLNEANYVSTHKIIAVEEDTYKDLVRNSQAFKIIKDNFIWLEDDEDVFVGIPYDCEIELTKDEFESEEEYNSLKEALL